MSKPEISLENYEAIYEHYSDSGPNEDFAWFAHRAFAWTSRPKLHFARDVRPELEHHLDKGGLVIMAANHVNEFDQYALASMFYREETFHPMIGHTVIPGKAKLFTDAGGILRKPLDAMGAIPTFRVKDLDKYETEVSSEKAELQRSSREALVGACISQMLHGRHLAIFPESTRNKVDVTKVQKIKRGIGAIACAVSTQVDVPVGVIPVGIYYGDRKTLSPTMYVGDMFYGPFKDEEKFKEKISTKLQASLNEAVFEGELYAKD